jgi:hypothetical protein
MVLKTDIANLEDQVTNGTCATNDAASLHALISEVKE